MKPISELLNDKKDKMEAPKAQIQATSQIESGKPKVEEKVESVKQTPMVQDQKKPEIKTEKKAAPEQKSANSDKFANKKHDYLPEDSKDSPQILKIKKKDTPAEEPVSQKKQIKVIDKAKKPPQM